MAYDPYKFDASAISPSAAIPSCRGAVSACQHPFGVEWGTGRDIFSQLLWGMRISLLIASTATILTVTFGTVIGIIAGYTGGWTDQIIGRFMDLVLAFPFLLIILAMSTC